MVGEEEVEDGVELLPVLEDATAAAATTEEADRSALLCREDGGVLLPELDLLGVFLFLSPTELLLVLISLPWSAVATSAAAPPPRWSTPTSAKLSALVTASDGLCR